MVNCLTVVGVLVELMFTISRNKRINFVALEETDLPDCVNLNLDGRREIQKVCCYDADRTLAIRVGKLIRAKLSHCNLEVVRACVEVQLGGRRKGEHDLICEVVGGSGSELIRQYLSVELKLRTLFTDAGLAKARAQQRKECCDEAEWWQVEKSSFCGRLIILGCFSEKACDELDAKTYKLSKFKLFGDLRMRDEKVFRGVFGWGDAKAEVTWATPVALAPPTSKAKARATATPKAKAKARATAAAPAVSFSSSVVDTLVFKDGVAEVGALLKALGKNATKSSYWARKAKRRHRWNDQELYQQGRSLDTSLRGMKRKRQGGSQSYVGNRAVLVQMVKDMGL